MDVWIRESRLRSLLTSAIEVYNRETDGVFSGKFVLRKIRGKKRPHEITEAMVHAPKD